jgi:hypothetical protein
MIMPFMADALARFLLPSESSGEETPMRTLHHSLAALALTLTVSCGGESDAGELLAEPSVATVPGVDLGKADGYRLYRLTSVRIPAALGATETRKVFTTAASFKRAFGVDAPVDFSRRWVVFYSAGFKPTGGYSVSIPLVRLSATGRTLEVTTRLDSPGDGCPAETVRNKPAIVASFPRPSPEPGTVRYSKSDRKPAACAANRLCGDTLRDSLLAASSGLLWMSESDYPFDYFARPGAATQPLTAARLLTLLGRPSSTPVEIRTLDDMFSWITRDDPEMDEWERTNAVGYRALRAVLDRELRDMRVWKVGRIQVEIYFIGTTACGDIAGLSSISIET